MKPPKLIRNTAKVAQRSRRRGFSFAETLLSVFIVGSAATIIGATMPVATISRNKAATANIAANYAQKQLEKLKNVGYVNLTPQRLHSMGLIDSLTAVVTTTVNQVGNTVSNVTSGLTGGVTADFSTITNYSMNAVDSSFNGNIARLLPNGTATLGYSEPTTELKQLVITVQWQERGKTRSYVVGTQVANL